MLGSQNTVVRVCRNRSRITVKPLRLRGPSQIELSLRDRKRRMTEAKSAEGGEEVISGGE